VCQPSVVQNTHSGGLISQYLACYQTSLLSWFERALSAVIMQTPVGEKKSKSKSITFFLPRELNKSSMITPFYYLAVIVFACGQEVFIHESLLTRYEGFSRHLPSAKSSSPTKIRIDGRYNRGGYLIVHWLYHQDLRHNYVGVQWSLEGCQDHLHALVEAYAMAIKIGQEDFANEIPHLAKELFYYCLPLKTVRKVAIQLASHDLQGSGLMRLTLEERESRRFPRLNDEIQEEMKEEEEDGPSTSRNLWARDWDLQISRRRYYNVEACHWHEHNHTPLCSLQGTGHGTINSMNEAEHLSNR
jgi:hypothetical protein